jgi:hypothetical protein
MEQTSERRTDLILQHKILFCIAAMPVKPYDPGCMKGLEYGKATDARSFDAGGVSGGH